MITEDVPFDPSRVVSELFIYSFDSDISDQILGWVYDEMSKSTVLPQCELP